MVNKCLKSRRRLYDAIVKQTTFHPRRGGGGDSAYERGGDARRRRRKFWIKPLKEIWAWPKPFLTPKRDHVETQTIYIFLYFFTCNPKRDLNVYIWWRFAQNTLSETRKRKFTPLSDTTSIPTPFICGVPPPGLHQFHGLKSNRRLDFAAQLSHDTSQNKVCFTSFKY